MRDVRGVFFGFFAVSHGARDRGHRRRASAAAATAAPPAGSPSATGPVASSSACCSSAASPSSPSTSCSRSSTRCSSRAAATPSIRRPSGWSSSSRSSSGRRRRSRSGSSPSSWPSSSPSSPQRRPDRLCATRRRLPLRPPTAGEAAPMSTLPLARLFGFEIRIHVSWAIILAVIAVTVVSEVATIAPDSDPIVRWLVGGVVAGRSCCPRSPTSSGMPSPRVGRGAPGRRARRLLLRRGRLAEPRDPTAAGGDRGRPGRPGRQPRPSGARSLPSPLAGRVVGGDVARALGQIAPGRGHPQPGPRWREPAAGLPARRRPRGPRHRLVADRRRDGRAAHERPHRPLAGHRPGVLGVGIILRMDSIDGLMLALCGWFLVSSARAVERSAAVEDLLRGLLVEDAMDTRHHAASRRR